MRGYVNSTKHTKTLTCREKETQLPSTGDISNWVSPGSPEQTSRYAKAVITRWRTSTIASAGILVHHENNETQCKWIGLLLGQAGYVLDDTLHLTLQLHISLRFFHKLDDDAHFSC
jgi:hypothetical protein